MTKSLTPSVGEEQMIDVELDRNTPLKEADASYSDVICWDQGINSRHAEKRVSSVDPVPDTEIPGILSSLSKS
jgi:hypothetical protein